jgi:hypothetical protein
MKTGIQRLRWLNFNFAEFQPCTSVQVSLFGGPTKLFKQVIDLDWLISSKNTDRK